MKEGPDIAPEAAFDFRRGGQRVLLLACGALGCEIVGLIEANRWTAFDVDCLPAIWHNTPQKIPGGLRDKIRAAKGKYERIVVAYGDCGTGGDIDRVLAEEGGIERIEGPHCYAFFSGNARFAAAAETDDMTVFYLTDYLARHFDKLVWCGLLGLDRHPELRDDYFRHYTKVVYLAQTDDPELDAKAEAAAERLGLAYERRFTGYGELAGFMRRASDG